MSIVWSGRYAWLGRFTFAYRNNILMLKLNNQKALFTKRIVFITSLKFKCIWLLYFVVLTFLSTSLKAQLSDSTIRLVHVKGTLNFRDIGGYKTNDGKEVIWGKLYRSAAINKLTDEDLDTLKTRHINTIIDFRGTKEAAMAPDKYLSNTDYTLCPAGSDSMPNIQNIIAMIKEGNGKMLDNIYGEPGAQYLGARYKPFFQKLISLSDNEAILYHCTGGRDRTGIATALLLYLLGVPQHTIEEDFVASNIYLGNSLDAQLKPLSQIASMSLDSIHNEMTLRPELLRKMFNVIKTRYGSIENFFVQELDLTKDKQELLIRKFTK
jgi:protein-tyrosine phosphatase